jgi:acetolactate synthase-1/2/3 large subunit
VSTAAGKGVFPETHPLALGVFGTFGTAAANAAVSGADLILAVGTKLGPSDTAWENRDLLDPTRQTFIQIDIEPKNASWTFPAEHVVVGDAAIVLTQMLETVASKSSGRRDAGESRVADLRRAHGYFNARAYTADDAPLLPQRVIGELMRRNKPAAFCRPRAPARWALPFPRQWVPSWFTPIAVCGDGGFAMTMNGLMTALEHDIPIIVVVFNNNALGWVYHGSGPFAAEFKDFDHGAIARAMGCEGVRVTEPKALGPALVAALQCFGVGGRRQPHQRRVRPGLVGIVAPRCGLVLACGSEWNSVSFNNSSRRRPSKLSTNPFC